MEELPDALYEQVQQRCDDANELMDQRRYDEALACFSSAWELLPEPRTDWEAAPWILGGIADAHFAQGRFAAMHEPLMTAMQCHEATTNPFLRLRLGECLFELGEFDEAVQWLAGAYLLEGATLFNDEEPKYLAFVKSKLTPPPEGWPEGW